MSATFEVLLRRYNTLQSELQRIQGRKEEAERQLESLRTACIAKQIDPETLGERIQNMESDLAREMASLEGDLTRVEKEASVLLKQAMEGA